MTGFEVDSVVPDTLTAFAVYHSVFGAEAAEKTACDKGLNEVAFTVFGNRFHMLDKNPRYGLAAPSAGFTVIQPIQELKDFGVKNAIQKDRRGYRQANKAVSFEEPCNLIESRRCKQ
jgi:PhnB protein